MQRARTASALVLAMILALVGVFAPGRAFAEEEAAQEGLVAMASGDIMLGMFYTSDSDPTDSIYASYDGATMTRIATVYATQGRDGNGNAVYYDGDHNAHYSHVDPSIMFYNGKFWALSNDNRYDGKFHPMVSYSTDLVRWTHPEGGQLLGGIGHNGISLAQWPSGFNAGNKGFDVVAPEWFVSKNGSVYIVFSAGFYGAFHGQPTNDRMQAYYVKINLSAGNGTADKSTGYLWPSGLTLSAGSAYRLNIPGNADANANFIDGAFFNDGGADYLVIKKDGLTNQLYSTGNIDANQWGLVNGQVTHGYEGASIAKLNGTYYLAADHVVGSTADGVKFFASNSITNGAAWAQQGTRFASADGATLPARHGTIITLPAGSAGWNVAAKLLGTNKWGRLAGSNRYGTMSQIVSTAFAKSDWAVVATGRDFPDALAASALAGARGCPVILTASDALSGDAQSQLKRLGVKNAVLVGGAVALSPAVESSIRSLGINVSRVAGTNRVGTSIAVFSQARTVKSSSDTVIVATGKNFADALSIGPWSYANAAPIVLAQNDGTLSNEAVQAIKADKGIKRVVIVGGGAAVSDAVKSQLGGYTFERLGGANRYETSRDIANWEASHGLKWTTPSVATGGNFPDALAGAALAGRKGSVLLLVNSPNSPTIASLKANKGAVDSGYILGGTSAVNGEIESALRAATK